MEYQEGNQGDDTNREDPHRDKVAVERGHPQSHDREPPGRQDLKEVAVEYFATQDALGGMQENTLIAQPREIADEG